MEILGHRGWPTPVHPENTLAAVEAALATGADGVEVDVRLTADGAAVCWHDADLLRVAGVPRRLRSLTRQDLRRVTLPSGHRVAELREVVKATSGRCRLVVDLKSERRPAEIAAAGAAAVRLMDPATVVMSSFDSRVLDLLATTDPVLPRAHIVEPGQSVADALQGALRRGDAALHVPIRTVLAEPEAVREAVAAGLTVRAWTVNRRIDAQLCEVLGVAGVITDVPADLVRTAAHTNAVSA